MMRDAQRNLKRLAFACCMMSRRIRVLLLIVVVGGVIAVGIAAALRFQALKRLAFLRSSNPAATRALDADLWARSVEKLKEDRSVDADSAVAIEIPTELRHYSDRHWFLAAQVAEVRKFNLQSCQDYVDLASMIERGELVTLPAVTDTYILYGVGAKADDGVFSRYIDDQSIELYDENELRAAYEKLETERAKLQTERSGFQSQLGARKKVDRTRRAELQKEITAREQELKANQEEKALLDQSYGRTESREELWRDFGSLQKLAKNFGGRSFNLDAAADRQALRVSMLSSIRPQALRILEEVAKNYHDKFSRPLPVSSLVRPEQYQHALRKVNRNAVLIDTPPHSTGLAFDIDYRYMSGAEQNFIMAQLARMKNEGRIEAIRERNANYHVFVFIDGKRPSDELITASLKDAGALPEETEPAAKTPAKVVSKTGRGTKRTTVARSPTKANAKRRRR
jgi:hypothetical protein